MGSRSVKHVLALVCSLWIVAGSAVAQEAPEPFKAGFFPVRGAERGTPVRRRIASKAALLTYHGGPTITSAKVVLIFWGPSFSNPGSPDFAYAQTLISFRNQLGTTPEYQTITEYSGIQLSNLGSGTADWFDTSAPPANVTDTAVQGEVNLYLASHSFDATAIYEVVLPSTSYSSNGTSTSCGGPALAYCAYHSWIGSGASATKYSVQPYPSCSGCQVAGWSAVQNQEHFITHETREAVTDPTGAGWFDAGGFEADDECAWSPPPFFGTGGYGYQFEWSNAANKCISFPNAGPPPAVPTLTITNEACNGLNTADWTAASGATAYELWGSSSSTFTFSSLFYSGPDTTQLLNVGGTTYFHVRACNANGCSAFSNTRIARHINGCL
ncbi:MAG: hypothetical protein QOF89_2833 [Acidobacteriota bacterium]|nr:hypothetical protein [Acidobacteriota bacterium]